MALLLLLLLCSIFIVGVVLIYRRCFVVSFLLSFCFREVTLFQGCPEWSGRVLERLPTLRLRTERKRWWSQEFFQSAPGGLKRSQDGIVSNQSISTHFENPCWRASKQSLLICVRLGQTHPTEQKSEVAINTDEVDKWSRITKQIEQTSEHRYLCKRLAR